jgi:hypothetical protein
MNERIKELLVNAMTEVGPDDTDLKTLKKFAELIIRECITVIENKMPNFTCKEDYENLIRKADRMDSIDEIKEHFGVER